MFVAISLWRNRLYYPLFDLQLWNPWTMLNADRECMSRAERGVTSRPGRTLCRLGRQCLSVASCGAYLRGAHPSPPLHPSSPLQLLSWSFKIPASQINGLSLNKEEREARLRLVAILDPLYVEEAGPEPGGLSPRGELPHSASLPQPW